MGEGAGGGGYESTTGIKNGQDMMGRGVSGVRWIFGLALGLFLSPWGLGGIMGNDWMTRKGKGQKQGIVLVFAFGGLSVFHGYGSVEDLEGPFASWIMRPVGTLLQGTGL